MNRTSALASVAGQSRLLKQIASDLLSPDSDYPRQSTAVRDLFALCSAITGVTRDSTLPDDLRKTHTVWGEAISPKDAATCLLDVNRTVKFLAGIEAAILTLRSRFPHTRIEILYAGCGPFAPLAIPLTNRFNADQIQFTLLDLHQRSLDAAGHLFEALGLSAFLRNSVQVDATSYRHDRQLHLIISEAMQRALEKEPQVAITLNLAPQLHDGGIFIPEKIAIDACLADLNTELSRKVIDTDGRGTLPPDLTRIRLGRLLELTAESCRETFAFNDHNGVSASFPNVVISLPEELQARLDLLLSTTITVFESVVLGEYESGLTHPAAVYQLGKLPGGARIEFHYRMDEKPGFTYRLL